MTRRLISALLAVLAAPLHADPYCDDLWFARNQLYDRAGYCFSSALGQAVFDNAGCTGTDVTLEPGGEEMVAAIKAAEARADCSVDTTRERLEVENLELRLRLDQVVYRAEDASGCLGWTGGPLTLLAGPDENSLPIAWIENGDDIIWQYESLPWPEGWTFVSIFRDGMETGFGWRISDIYAGLCTSLAG